MSAARPVDVARFGLGLVAATRPGLVLRVSRGDAGRAARVAVRILGARYLLQSGAGLALGRTGPHPWRPGARRPWLRDADAVVDLIHAATMVGLAAVAPEHRRLALLSAGAATVFAAADLQETLP